MSLILRRSATSKGTKAATHLNFVRKRRGCVFEKTEARSRYDLVNLMWNMLVPVKFEAPANG